jgi:hypothetical protein
MAKESLYWHRPYKTVRAGGFEAGDIQWFPEGGTPFILCTLFLDFTRVNVLSCRTRA